MASKQAAQGSAKRKRGRSPGHVLQRGRKWAFVISVRDEGGKPKQQWVSGFRTQRDAQGALTKTLASVEAGAFVKPKKQTLALFLDEWLEGHRAQVRPSTWHGYRKNIAAHIKPQIGNVLVQQLTPARLNNFYANLQRRDGKGTLSGRSVRHVHVVLHRALRDAVRWRLLSNNPADQADPPRSAAHEMRTWAASELRAFLQHVREDRLYALWLLLSSTGMRRGEALGLRSRDLDLEAGRAAVVQTLLDVDHKLTFGTPKTAKGRRSVALDRTTVAALREHKQRQAAEIMRFGRADWPDHDLVFTREDGAPVHPAWLSRAFQQRARAAGLPVIRLHDLRHTHATLALQAGVHPKVVSERLGHSTVSITLDTYSHSVPAMQEEAAEKVAALVLGGSS